MTPAQMEALRQAMNIRPGHEWEPFEGLERGSRAGLQEFLDRVPFAAGGAAPQEAPRIAVPAQLAAAARRR